MRFRQRAAEHGEVFGEYKSLAAVDGAPAGDDAVAGHFRLLHAEFGGAVLDEHVELLERALVEQKLDALARGELAARMLRLDALLAAAELCARATFFEGVQNVLHCFRPLPRLCAPERSLPLDSLIEHDPCGKPVPTFPGSCLVGRVLNTAFSERETGALPMGTSGAVQ
jgi:hypothetical protein